jgi:hypothetical protein
MILTEYAHAEAHDHHCQQARGTQQIFCHKVAAVCSTQRQHNLQACMRHTQQQESNIMSALEIKSSMFTAA